jgi:hypothetical protein
MTGTKYIGMDVHKGSISIAVRNSVGKVVMECVIETKASTILRFIDGLRGELRVTFEEGTWAAWLYDLMKHRSVQHSPDTVRGKSVPRMEQCARSSTSRNPPRWEPYAVVPLVRQS